MSLYSRGLGHEVSIGAEEDDKSHPMATATIIAAGLLAIFVGIPAIRRSRVPSAHALEHRGMRRGLPVFEQRLRDAQTGRRYR